MKKKALIFMLAITALFCVFALTACGGDNSPTDGNQTEQNAENKNENGDDKPQTDEKTNQDSSNNTENQGDNSGGENSGSNETTSPQHTHQFSAEWSADDSNHWHAATCGHSEKKDEAAHTYENGVCTICQYTHENHSFGNWSITKKSTCKENGYKERVCSVCNKTEKETLPLEAHSYENGVCTTCDLAHENHSFDNWADKKQPTCTEDGYKERTCTVCGKIERQTLARLGHTYENGVCKACGSVQDLIAFKTLKEDNADVYGKVSNATQTFSFINEIITGDGVTFTVSKYLSGTPTIPSKTVSLNEGDNVYYILASREETLKLYTVVVRRRPMYTINFVTSGSAVTSQLVEEDNNIAQPAATIKTGYTFQKWTLNGNAVDFPYLAEEGISHTSNYNVAFNAVFTANSYTATLNAAGGDMDENEQTVTYDQRYDFPIPTRTGYTFTGWFADETQITDTDGACLNVWNYDGDKNIVAHWQVNYYELTIEGNLSEAGTCSGGDTYAYDSAVTISAISNIGYSWIGWYSGDDELSDEQTYSFKMGAEDLNLQARWKLNEEMENFIFGSTQTDCIISGVKNESILKIVVPDYVTQIENGAFGGCIHLADITLPFIGESKKTGKDIIQYPFGYIFGESAPIVGSSPVEQYYYKNGISSSSSITYYIPDSLKNVTVTGDEIHYRAFFNCTEIEQITIGDDVTLIGESAFSGNSKRFAIGSSLTRIIIGDSVASIGDYAFSGCQNLSQVYISDLATWCNIEFGSSTANPLCYADFLYFRKTNQSMDNISADMLEGVTEIKDYAFYGYTYLKSITIPVGLSSIGEKAFKGCANLESVTFENTTGWKVSEYKDMRNVIFVTLDKPEENAELLKNTYTEYYWKRED